MVIFKKHLVFTYIYVHQCVKVHNNNCHEIGMEVTEPLEGKKEMFYLTTHTTHFIYSYMVKDHSDSEKGNPLPPHRLLICTIHTDRIAHTTAFVTPVVEHWLEREIAQWVHPMKDRSDDPLHHELHLALQSH